MGIQDKLGTFSVRPDPNGSAERSAEINRTGSAEPSVNLAHTVTTTKQKSPRNKNFQKLEFYIFDDFI